MLYVLGLIVLIVSMFGLLFSTRLYMVKRYFRNNDEATVGGAIMYSHAIQEGGLDLLNHDIRFFHVVLLFVVFNASMILMGYDGLLFSVMFLIVVIGSIFLGVLDVLKIKYHIYSKDEETLHTMYNNVKELHDR